MPILKVVRTPKSGAWGADHFPGYGTVLRAIDDPEGVEITSDLVKAIRLDPEFLKIPPNLANRISDLYVQMLNRGAGKNARAVDGQKEVSVVLLRDEETLKKWRVLVPEQVVGGASVNADYERPLCDIETGEEIKTFPPPGWMVAGTSHSHNTMGAFFSGTDDRNELPQPGLHFVCGSFEKSKEGGWHFAVACSMVYHGMRYESVIGEDGKPRKMVWSDIADFSDDGGPASKAHENVHNYVKIETPKDWDTKGFGAGVGIEIPFARSSVAGYGMERDWLDSMYGSGYGAGYYAADRKGDVEDMEIVEMVGATDEDLVDYIREFDTFIDSGNLNPSRSRDLKLKPNVPVIVLPMTLDFKVGGNARMREEFMTVKSSRSRWAMRQRCWGSSDAACGIVFENSVGPEVEWWMAPDINSKYLVRCKFLFYHQLKKHAKGQRKELKWNKIFENSIDHKSEFKFETRGVKSEDFTQTEIEELVAAWCSNIKQRTDLRMAIRKSLPDLNEGTSVR